MRVRVLVFDYYWEIHGFGMVWDGSGTCLRSAKKFNASCASSASYQSNVGWFQKGTIKLPKLGQQ